MICVSLGDLSFRECQGILARVGMAELRLDLMRLSLAEVERLFSFHSCLIATCRRGRYSEAERTQILLRAIEAGAAYLDLDLEEDSALRGFLEEKRQAAGCRLILSHHNERETPAMERLKGIIDRAFSLGADVAKIACFCQEARDNARLLSLLTDPRPVVVCGLGPRGEMSRVAAPLCGSPFTYGSWEGIRPTAPGQMTWQRLHSIYGLLGKIDE